MSKELFIVRGMKKHATCAIGMASTKAKTESEDRKTLWEEFSFSIQAADKTLASFISGQ